MNREEIFAVWARPGAVWTPWAKAVVFAHITSLDLAPWPTPPMDMSWLDTTQPRAIVLDLPGATGVEAGITLANVGYRPVPLYNAVPGAPGADELVKVRSILRALAVRAEALSEVRLPFNAPPAFLLDAERRGIGRSIHGGRLDNRSICFPTDFPSAAFLSREGLKGALVVSEADLYPQTDLSHVLLRWQEAGLEIHFTTLNGRQPPIRIQVQRPPLFHALSYGWRAMHGLKRSLFGGFGAQLPLPGEWGAAG